MGRKDRIRWLALTMAGLLFLSGCSGGEPEPTAQVGDLGGLVCMEYSRYTGSFPEDGSGRQVEDVAAILVRNSSDEFLDYATIEAQVGDQIGTFYVTGLPPGGTAWVLEKDALTLTPDETFRAEPCEDYFYRSDAVIRTDDLSVSAEGNVVTVTNASDKTLENVCIYYKTVHEDGNYFGGITYLLSFDTMGPGQTLTKQSSHYGASSRIVRYSYQESG